MSFIDIDKTVNQFMIWCMEREKIMPNSTIEITADPYGRDLVFYTLMDDGLHISPDISELIRLKGSSAKINRDALKMYLIFQYVPTCETIVKDIFRLAPGNTLRYAKEKGIEIKEYTHPVFAPEGKSMEKAAEDIRSVVSSAVKKCTVGCHEKIGCFLSGGVDSSYIAALLRPDYSFTFGFQESVYDESGYAKELSEKLCIENFCRYLSGDEFFDAVPKVQKIIGQPYANLTGVPVYYMAELAAGKTHTVFSGEGPDELFGGYDTYCTGTYEKVFRKLPLGLRRLVAGALSIVPNERLKNFLNVCISPVEETYIGVSKIMSDREADELLSHGYNSTFTFADVTAPYFKKIRSGSDLEKKQYLDCCLWGPFDNIYSLFLIGKHFGLDIRTPFMEDEVISSALSLRDDQRVDGFATKIAFRKAAEEYLPEEICNRPKKGMLMPYGEWFRDEKHLKQIEEAFSESYVQEFFNTELLGRMLDEHRAQKKNNAIKLYVIYCFVLWYKYFLELTHGQQ